MKKFVVQSGLFVLILLMICTLVEFIINKNTEKKQYLFQADWHCLKNRNYKILVIGNSRVWVQVDVKKICKSLNTKAFALAQDGRDISFLWAKFKIYIKDNDKPTHIFLEYDPFFLSGADTAFFDKDVYLSYLFLDRLGINRLYKNQAGYHFYDQYIPLIRYCGYSDIFIQHLTGRAKLDSSFKYGSSLKNLAWGAKPWKAVWNNPNRTDSSLTKISYIDSFVNYCKSNQISLHLFYPPQSWTSYNAVGIKTVSQLNNFLENKHLEFYDFNSRFYNDSTLFYNHLHLNSKGSSIFTDAFLKHYFPK